MLVDELDDRILDVEAGVLRERFGHDHHCLRIRLDAKLRSALDGGLELLEAVV